MMDVLFLEGFTVIRPDPGTIIWTTIIFGLFWLLMSRLAFKPISKALKQRESDIQHSLDEAKRAREEMSQLKSENEALLAKAQEERAMILREAKEAKESIISEAREKANEEYHKILQSAKQEIENQRMAAVIDLKNQVGTIAIEIAEKVIQRELKSDKDHARYVEERVKEITI